MRKLTSLVVAALLAVAMAACDEQPTELTQDTQPTPNSGVKASQGTSPGSSGMTAETTWGNNHLWRFLIPKSVQARLTNSEGIMVFGHPSEENSTKPMYQIGPGAGDDGAQADHPTPHDHVTTVPRNNKESYTAICNYKVVFPTSGAEEGVDVATSGDPIAPVGGLLQAHAADIDGDGTPEDLTSVEKVRAAEARGHVFILSTPLQFTCPLKDVEG